MLIKAIPEVQEHAFIIYSLFPAKQWVIVAKGL